jgi:nicotinamide-nucleotide amidase
VSYAPEVKFDLLGVDPGPVVSLSAAQQMALGARALLGADVAIGVTGVAGPEPSEGLRPGTVCIAVCLGDPANGGVVETSQIQLPGGRRQVREFSVITALALLRRQLLLGR